MAYYLFNFVSNGDGTPAASREKATLDLRARMWGVDPSERLHDALAPGDVVVLYVGAPDWKFIGRAELASAVHRWTPSEARAYTGEALGGVLLAEVEEWDPAVPMASVLSEIAKAVPPPMPGERGARADYEEGVIRIRADEYKIVIAVARGGRGNAEPN